MLKRLFVVLATVGALVGASANSVSASAKQGDYFGTVYGQIPGEAPGALEQTFLERIGLYVGKTSLNVKIFVEYGCDYPLASQGGYGTDPEMLFLKCPAQPHRQLHRARDVPHQWTGPDGRWPGRRGHHLRADHRGACVRHFLQDRPCTGYRSMSRRGQYAVESNLRRERRTFLRIRWGHHDAMEKIDQARGQRRGDRRGGDGTGSCPAHSSRFRRGWDSKCHRYQPQTLFSTCPRPG